MVSQWNESTGLFRRLKYRGKSSDRLHFHRRVNTLSNDVYGLRYFGLCEKLRANFFLCMTRSKFLSQGL